MTMRTNPSPEDYRVPSAPEGTVEFISGEQVDFHLSSLDRLASDAIRLAEPSHIADPESVDTRRIEFGGTVIEAASVQPEQYVDYPTLTQPEMLRAHGAWITRARQVELDSTDKAA